MEKFKPKNKKLRRLTTKKGFWIENYGAFSGNEVGIA